MEAVELRPFHRGKEVIGFELFIDGVSRALFSVAFVEAMAKHPKLLAMADEIKGEPNVSS